MCVTSRHRSRCCGSSTTCSFTTSRAIRQEPVIIRAETSTDRALTAYSLLKVSVCEGVVQRCLCVAEYGISSN
jgi:hypothetical protein